MQTVREPRISRATEELKVSQDQYCDLEDNQQKLEGWIPVQTLPDSNELKYAPSPKSKTGISMLEMASQLNVLDGTLYPSNASLVFESRHSGDFSQLKYNGTQDDLWQYLAPGAKEPQLLTPSSAADVLDRDSKLNGVNFDPTDARGITSTSILRAIENYLLIKGLRPTNKKSTYRRSWPSKSIRADGSNDATVQLTIVEGGRNNHSELAVCSSYCIDSRDHVDNVGLMTIYRLSSDNNRNPSANRGEANVTVSGYIDPKLASKIAKAEQERSLDHYDILSRASRVMIEKASDSIFWP